MKTYDLSVTTDLGKLKIGEGKYKLVVDNNDEDKSIYRLNMENFI